MKYPLRDSSFEFPEWNAPKEFLAATKQHHPGWAGFEDSSWHNDSCPSWENQRLNLKLWVEDAEHAMRDMEGTTTYQLCIDIESPISNPEYIATRDLEVILVAVRKAHERLVKQLATAFCSRIRRDLADNLQRAIELNRMESDTGCASHDFIDSNVTMQEAWQSIPDLGDNEVDCEYCAEIWNNAWQLAKRKSFAMNPRQRGENELAARRHIVLTEEESAMARDAIPLDHDDDGSERQVDAANKWYHYLKTQLSREAMSEIEDYALGATSEEIVLYGLGILVNTDRTKED